MATEVFHMAYPYSIWIMWGHCAYSCHNGKLLDILISIGKTHHVSLRESFLLTTLT